MENIKCPFCGMVDCAGAMLCKRCGAKIEVGDEASEHARNEFRGFAGDAQPASGRLKTCPVCLLPCAKSARSCPRCGHAMAHNVAAIAGWAAFAIVPVLILVVAFVMWRYYMTKTAEARLKIAEAEIASQYGIVDTTVAPQEQKPWFWSLLRNDPTPQEIFEHSEEVGGGREALRAVKSARMHGQFFVVDRSTPQSAAYFADSGQIVVQAKPPNLVASEMEFARNRYSGELPQVGLVRRGFDGSRGWEYVERYAKEIGYASPVKRAELRTLAGAELGRLKSHAEAVRLVNLKDRFASLTLAGKQKVGTDVSSGMSVNARETYVVRGLNFENRQETFYFDIETGLLSRLDFTEGVGDETVAVECYPLDYKEVGNVKLPFRMVYKVNRLFITITFDDINLNTEIADSTFAMPAS